MMCSAGWEIKQWQKNSQATKTTTATRTAAKSNNNKTIQFYVRCDQDQNISKKALHSAAKLI